MKRLLKTFGAQISKVVFSFSIVLLVSLAYCATDYVALERGLSEIKDPAAGLRMISHSLPDSDPIRKIADDALGSDSDQDAAFAKCVSLVGGLATAQKATSASADPSIRAEAKKIKEFPLYRDSGNLEESNWLARALERLKNLFNAPQMNSPKGINPNLPVVGSWFVYLMWFVLGGGILVFAYFVIKQISWKKRLTRKAKALLDDDEPERTLDEWLALADSLEREGRYREAIRCLYLACLLKFDEHNVARFDRGETNWEHLQRIEASPRLPRGLRFLEPTRAFDRFWYGGYPSGAPEVMNFRQWYSEITDALQKVAA